MKITIKIEDGMNRKIRFVIENPDPDTAFLAACRALNSLREERAPAMRKIAEALKR